MSFKPVERVFDTIGNYSYEAPMTLEGSIRKTGLLLATLAVGAVSAWYLVAQNLYVMPAFYTTLIGGFILSLVTIFRPQYSPYTAVPYAFCEGIVLGVLSAIFEIKAPGIAMIAVALTSATAIGMLLLYRLEIIRVTETFKAVIASATLGIALTYGILILLSIFGINTGVFFENSSTLSIGFSVFVVAIAAFNLLLDFARIEEGVERELPKFMEWFSAFSILVTLVWLYLEILRLLLKLSQRREN